MTRSTTPTDVLDVVVLGSTGSVGTQALDVARSHPERFRIAGLAAGGSDPALLARQVVEFSPPVVALADPDALDGFEVALDRLRGDRSHHDRTDVAAPLVLLGPDAAADLASAPADVVLNAVSGAAGLDATLSALDAGRRLALANKESLIIGGDLVVGRAEPGQIVPVDSEHSALSQCLRSGRLDEVRRLLVTASGGPFRGRTRDQLRDVTAAEALSHPTWSMGPLITTNSATLVNKGLEVIEANLLFGIDFDRIEVVVHPASIVHSMVEFVDGTTMVQAGRPDMRLAIAYALTDGDRLELSTATLDWTAPRTWEFEPVDHDVFPAIELAVEAGRQRGLMPAVFNGANEALVGAFLAGRLSFLEIADTIAVVMHSDDVPSSGEHPTRDEVVQADSWAREHVAALLGARRAQTISEVSDR